MAKLDMTGGIVLKSNLIKDQSTKQESVEESNVICQLVELMKSVDINASEAKLNATTISDGKGGRILL